MNEWICPSHDKHEVNLPTCEGLKSTLNQLGTKDHLQMLWDSIQITFIQDLYLRNVIPASWTTTSTVANRSDLGPETLPEVMQ